jgi:hypothetical protein
VQISGSCDSRKIDERERLFSRSLSVVLSSVLLAN